ncbi:MULTISPECIES: hypothetical protein [Halorussus]|uniref:hypothetical protein n=1 Tax=Halorussus TaxID=1070314 RepID=UPI0020A1B7C0|nr:hypothetical protein [Halorussus vallis]USZ78217.1 hypothetical protein NGM07_21410 [Halorussus vallis]
MTAEATSDARDRVVSVTRTLAMLGPVVGAGAIVSLLLLGQTALAVLGSYAAAPLCLAPVLYRFANDDSPVELVRRIRFSRRAFAIVLLFGLSAALLMAKAEPRPRAFFVTLAFVNALAVSYSVVRSRVLLPLLALTATSLVFHLSTTLTNALFIGAGDTIWMWAAAELSARSGEFTTLAGYDSFPSFFVLVKVVGEVTSLSPRTALFVTSAVMYVAVLWILTWLTDKLDIVDTRYTLVPAYVLTLTYEFHYIGLYSLPRSIVSELSLLLVGLIAIVVVRRAGLNLQYNVLAGILVLSIPLYHKVGSFLVVLVLAPFLVLDRVVGRRLGDAADGSRYLYNAAALLVVLVGIQLYLVFQTGLPAYFVELVQANLHLGSLLGDTSSESSFAFASPYGLLSTFLGSSFVLALLMTGAFKVTGDLRRSVAVVTLGGVVLAPFYFPGPLQFLLLRIGVQRVAQYALYPVALVAAIGFVGLVRTRSGTLVAVVFVVAVLAGTVTYSNDMYTRDNPIKQTGTYSNYFTESERQAVEFALRHTDRVTSDRQTVSYLEYTDLVGRKTGRSYGSEVVTVENASSFCDVPMLVRNGELEQRGYLILPLASDRTLTDWASVEGGYVRYRSTTAIPCWSASDTVYDSGSVTLTRPPGVESNATAVTR